MKDEHSGRDEAAPAVGAAEGGGEDRGEDRGEADDDGRGGGNAGRTDPGTTPETSDAPGTGDPGGHVVFAVVRDRRAAELLADRDRARWLEPFLGRERSASEAARELGEALDTTLYRIGTLREAGLLEVVGERPRAGRPVKLYRAVADGFHVPFASTPYAELEERLLDDNAEFSLRAVEALARELRRHPGLGRRTYRDRRGRMMRDSGWADGVSGRPDASLAPRRGPVLGDVVTDLLELEDADARAMFGELSDVLERYAARRSERGARYLVGFTFVRDVADDDR